MMKNKIGKANRLFGTRLILLVSLLSMINPIARANTSPQKLSSTDVKGLMQSLRSRNGQTQCQAARKLRWVVPASAAKPAIPKLFELTKSKDACARAAAVGTLAMINAKDEETFRAVYNLVADKDEFVRWSAAQALIEVSCSQRFTDPKKLKRVEKAFQLSKGGKLRSSVLHAISCFGDMSFFEVSNAIYDKDQEVRKRAIISLSDIAVNSKDPKMVKKVKGFLKRATKNSPDKEIKELAKTTLASLNQRLEFKTQ